MQISNLMLMCVNMVCVSAAGLLVFWALMHIQKRSSLPLRVYDEPHFNEQRKNLGMRRAQDE